MLAARIALRYLLSKKSHAAVNVISGISLAGVAVAVAAIVIILSIFNGFAEVARQHLTLADPDLTVTPSRGKVSPQADSLARMLAALPEVAAATSTLTERGLLIDGDRRLPVVFKGVTEGYRNVVDVDRLVTQGAFYSDSSGMGNAPAQLAIGVAARMDLHPGISHPELYVPRRLGRINPANPATAFRSVRLDVTGVTEVDQMEYDADHIIIPLSDARFLLQYEDGEASAVELALTPGVSPSEGFRAVRSVLGPDFDLTDRQGLHAESLRMISVEKWVTFLMLAFILVIAAFNVISTLSLMVIEKRHDMETLRCLGARRRSLRAVFMWQGALITLAGAVLGIILGLALSLAQQHGKFITLGGDPTKMTIDVYPVDVQGADILAVAAVALAVALTISIITRLFTRKI